MYFSERLLARLCEALVLNTQCHGESEVLQNPHGGINGVTHYPKPFPPGDSPSMEEPRVSVHKDRLKGSFLQRTEAHVL